MHGYNHQCRPECQKIVLPGICDRTPQEQWLLVDAIVAAARLSGINLRADRKGDEVNGHITIHANDTNDRGRKPELDTVDIHFYEKDDPPQQGDHPGWFRRKEIMPENIEKIKQTVK